MRAWFVVLGLGIFAFARSAAAFEDFEGTRAEGMGGATRAWALGDSSLLLNPSGMSLAKTYNVEATYAYTSRFSGQFLHAGIVDSTSASNLAGGLYYTYHSDKSDRGIPGHGHEIGGAVSFPVTPSFALGATVKWFSLVGPDQGPASSTGGLTFDVGFTARPAERFSLAVVGANVRDLSSGQAPRLLTYGAAFLPIPDLVLALDGVTAFTRDDVTTARGSGARAGAEWTLAQRVTFRAGGGFDPMLGTGYVSGGASALSDIGAIDVGVRGDLWRYDAPSARNLFLGVSLRLFVDSAASSSEPEPPMPASSLGP